MWAELISKSNFLDEEKKKREIEFSNDDDYTAATLLHVWQMQAGKSKSSKS